MWPAEVTALEPASPLHLSVSLAWNGLQAMRTHIHAHTHTHVHRKTERVRK